ncbi:hypothetical protein LCGC14_3083470 [marine sediment metagenome]|uniref:Uncharacterized protein n=1 Tax=marine sediment metagenome TaxID=412755 RepID=A0A0F8WCJ4_9ZZZZ
MATTKTLQETVDWARTFTKLVPIVGIGGFSNEPALTICNSVIQEILSPPHKWKFNRAELTSFITIDGTQDYAQAATTDMSWLESCVIEDEANTSTSPDLKPTHEIEAVQDLPKESFKDNPEKVCILKEATTTTTLRFWKVPSTVVWRAYVVYQKKAVIKTALTANWSPIPDDLAWVYQQGFLAMAYKMADDTRAETEYRKFLRDIGRATAKDEAELQHEGFFPATPIMRG